MVPETLRVNKKSSVSRTVKFYDLKYYVVGFLSILQVLCVKFGFIRRSQDRMEAQRRVDVKVLPAKWTFQVKIYYNIVTLDCPEELISDNLVSIG